MKDPSALIEELVRIARERGRTLLDSIPDPLRLRNPGLTRRPDRSSQRGAAAAAGKLSGWATRRGERATEASTYKEYCRPDLAAFLEAIRLDVSYHRAEGNYLYYYDQDGREVEVLDLLGGYGALILGHHHPEIVELAAQMLKQKVPVQAQASVRSASARLARKLSDLVSGPSGEPYVVTFANSGAEAIEAAVKHAELEKMLEIRGIMERVEKHFIRLEEQLETNACYLPKKALNDTIFAGSGFEVRTLQDLRGHLLKHNSQVFQTPPLFLALEGAFHGKTVGALHLTANLHYREPFQRIGLRTRFLRKEHLEDFDAALKEGTLTYLDVGADEAGQIRVTELPFVNISACLVEPLQGEGGIFALSRGYLQGMRERCGAARIPLVLDEIQSGMGRTGSFLFSQQLGVRGDYYTLSKSLGGGLAKISALLVARSRYQPEFSLLHTSTFAEDDFSSRLGLKTLEILERDDWALVRACGEKGRTLLRGLRRIRKRYPDVIRDVRGAGLMIGLEFQDQYHASSNLLRQLSNQSDLVYCISGYLLHEHGIRVAPTLNQTFTLRIEPSALITRAEIDRFLGAVEKLAEIIRLQDTFHLCKYIAGMETPSRKVEVLDCRRPRVEDVSNGGVRRVAFLGHFIEARHLAEYDPALRRMPEERLDAFLRRIECRILPCVLSRVNVRSRLGDVVNFNFIGITMTSHRMVELMRSRDIHLARKHVDEAVVLARKCGAVALGLGQYTSIITRNCTDLVERDLVLTSGNSLTVAMGVEGILKAAAEKKIPLGSATLGVVGAGGNISSVYASIMADRVERLVLFGSPRKGAEEKCYRTAFRTYRELIEEMRFQGKDELAGIAARIYPTRTVQRALRDGSANPDLGKEVFFKLRREFGEDRFIRVSQDLRELRAIPLIVAAANAADPFIGPRHLKRNAVVCDIAVPMNTTAEVGNRRPDVLVIQGGIVKLPFGEDIGVKAIPLQPGTAFACMAETMLLGLTRIGFHYSFGDISKQQVKKIAELARIHGFSLAAYKTEKSF